MQVRWAQSDSATRAKELVESLQQRLRAALDRLSGETLTHVSWLRDDGRHGGGARYAAADTPLFNRAAINVSQVHYDDDPEKKLASASALSSIIHPRNPRAPSVHVHISFTEMKDGRGTWRLMADLNPSNADIRDTARFESALNDAAPSLYENARAQGDRYFYIPALERHRGVTHFYVESFASADRAADLALARKVGNAAIDAYVAIFTEAVARTRDDDAARAAQLAYHTVYFFQVLTLDRGTTSGLLVHDQNDLGIMGSLPAAIDRALLASWAPRVPPLQRPLVDALVLAVPPSGHVSDDVRAQLARVVRAHYQAHPEALALQAAGDTIPPTVDNHRGAR